MKYALNLAENGRILSATYSQFAPVDAVIVEALPEGDISDYFYIDNNFIYEPISVVDPEESYDPDAPSRLDIIEAQVTYTALMTDTLLEVL